MSPPPDPFTHAAYAACLDAARASGYAFVGFDAVRGDRRPDGPFILLRHDIDYDIAAIAPIARIEAERGVIATYFLQPAAAYYRFEDADTQAAVADLLAAGHRLGLHHDATAEPDDARVVADVEATALAWEARYGVAVDAVSFHMPTHRAVGHLALAGGRVNTYAPAFHTEIEYASDSNQHWRGKDLHRIVTDARPPALQVLTHPLWWQERFTPLAALLQRVADRCGLDVERDMLTPEQRDRLEAAPDA